jgi:hypothetical protein
VGIVRVSIISTNKDTRVAVLRSWKLWLFAFDGCDQLFKLESNKIDVLLLSQTPENGLLKGFFKNFSKIMEKCPFNVTYSIVLLH